MKSQTAPPYPTETIAEAMESFLATIQDSRSSNTAKAYGQALQAFSQVLLERKFDPGAHPSNIPEDAIAWFADALKVYAPATERLYLSAVIGFYEYLEGSGLAEPNLPRLKQLLKRRVRRPGQRLPQFPRDAIEKVLDYAERLASAPVENDIERLKFVAGARQLDFTLGDISEIPALRDRREPPCRMVLNLLEQKAQEVSKRIEELQKLEEDLQKLHQLGATFPMDDVDGKNCVCHLVSRHTSQTGNISDSPAIIQE